MATQEAGGGAWHTAGGHLVTRSDRVLTQDTNDHARAS